MFLIHLVFVNAISIVLFSNIIGNIKNTKGPKWSLSTKYFKLIP